jgi:LuxR family transcriptional regulator, maltose regulon positive regulatory protein
MLHAMVASGRHHRAEQILAQMDADERGGTPARTAEAALLLARAEPQAARNLLPSSPDDTRAGTRPLWRIAAFLLDAIACDALDRPDDAGDALERALDAAAPDNVLLPFLAADAPARVAQPR